MSETWRPLPGWEGIYEVSDHGRVKSLARKVSGAYHEKILTGSFDKNGYHRVQLSKGNKGRTVRVAPLVLLTFVGPRPTSMEACHNNGNPADDRLVNLRWDTHSANMLDRLAHGTMPGAHRTTCPRGHEYDAVRLRASTGRTFRTCSKCRAQQARERRARKAAALGAEA